jgi:TRAP-type C4-dicarboxylate transport system permease small subunit
MNIKKIIDKILDVTLTIILGLMAVIVAINVFSRFVLNSSIYWGDELALVLFVWLTFLGAAVGIRERAHYVFGYFATQLQGKPLYYYTLVGDSLTVISITVLLYYSTQVTLQINLWIMPAMEISRALVYGAAPVGCVFMLYYMGLRIFSQSKLDSQT